MICTIINRSPAPVSFRGNSGQTWHLAPGTSISLMDVEVTANAKVQRLAASGSIAIHPTEPPATDVPEPRRSRTPRSRRDEKR